jgi:predicted ester cyclase
LAFTIVTILSEGSQVAVRWRMSGVHRGDWMGMAPTGRTIGVYANVLYEMEDGKISRAWPQVDSIGLLRQLGKVGAGADEHLGPRAAVK